MSLQGTLLHFSYIPKGLTVHTLAMTQPTPRISPLYKCPSGLEFCVFPGVPTVSGPKLTRECADSPKHSRAPGTRRSPPATHRVTHPPSPLTPRSQPRRAYQGASSEVGTCPSPQSPLAQDSPAASSLPLFLRPHRPASGAVWLRSAIFCCPSASEPTRKPRGRGEPALGSGGLQELAQEDAARRLPGQRAAGVLAAGAWLGAGGQAGRERAS